MTSSWEPMTEGMMTNIIPTRLTKVLTCSQSLRPPPRHTG